MYFLLSGHSRFFFKEYRSKSLLSIDILGYKLNMSFETIDKKTIVFIITKLTAQFNSART